MTRTRAQTQDVWRTKKERDVALAALEQAHGVIALGRDDVFRFESQRERNRVKNQVRKS